MTWWSLLISKHEGRSAVDRCGAGDCPLVRERMRVAKAREREAVADPRCLVAMLGEPGDRSDRAGREDEPNGVGRCLSGDELPREVCRHGDSGEVVVAE